MACKNSSSSRVLEKKDCSFWDFENTVAAAHVIWRLAACGRTLLEIAAWVVTQFSEAVNLCLMTTKQELRQLLGSTLLSMRKEYLHPKGESPVEVKTVTAWHPVSQVDILLNRAFHWSSRSEFWTYAPAGSRSAMWWEAWSCSCCCKRIRIRGPTIVGPCYFVHKNSNQIREQEVKNNIVSPSQEVWILCL